MTMESGSVCDVPLGVLLDGTFVMVMTKIE